MPLKITGLKTSTSPHGLGVTDGKLFPIKAAGSGGDGVEGCGWIRMVDKNGNEGMLGPVSYQKVTYQDDRVVGSVSGGKPVRPYPFVFVGKLYDTVAQDIRARIKWTARWNGSLMNIAEEGRDWIHTAQGGATTPADLIASLPKVIAPPNFDIQTTGGNSNYETNARKPIVAAFRRYVIVYPDLPLQATGYPQSNGGYYHHRGCYPVSHPDHYLQTGNLELTASLYRRDVLNEPLYKEYKLYVRIT